MSAYLRDLGFEPPLSASRHRKSFIYDMFFSHSGAPEETASGHALLAVRRTPQALNLLVDFMNGKRLFAPQIEPQESGLLYVHRNVVYRTSAPPHHTGAAGGTAADRHNLLAAPTMILEPVDKHEALKYELVVRLLTTLGLSSDGFCTLMVSALRRSGTPHLGAAEICPDHHRSIAKVFTRVRGKARSSAGQLLSLQTAGGH